MRAEVVTPLDAPIGATEEEFGGRLREFGKPGEGNGDEDIVVRIRADAPVLRPDEPVPARLVLLCTSPGQ
jgi:hypothetical protein